MFQVKRSDKQLRLLERLTSVDVEDLEQEVLAVEAAAAVLAEDVVDEEAAEGGSVVVLAVVDREALLPTSDDFVVCDNSISWLIHSLEIFGGFGG